jgi:hypothetical protein
MVLDFLVRTKARRHQEMPRSVHPQLVGAEGGAERQWLSCSLTVAKERQGFDRLSPSGFGLQIFLVSFCELI